MLRVLSDAGALQEYLERAAATSTVDTTADEALDRIRAYRRDRVGAVRVGARGPLATAMKRRQNAEKVLDTAEERFESYQQLLAGRHTAAEDLRSVETRLREVTEHESERQRRERWKESRLAQRRLEQACQLTREVASGPTEVAPAEEVLASIAGALAAYEARPTEPAPLEEPTSEELEIALSLIPEVPKGDVEPAQEVSAHRETWQRGTERLASLGSNPPELSGAEDVPTQDEGTATEIEAQLASLPLIPIDDIEPEAEVAQLREAWHAVAQRLAAHESSSPELGEDEIPPLAEVTAAEVAAEIATLPDHPTGDMEQSAEVSACRETWSRSVERLAAHDGNPLSPQDTSPGSAAEDDEGGAAQIEAQLAGLPAPPTGDTEPAPEVSAIRDGWHGGRQRLAAHDDSEPPPAQTRTVPVEPDELRRIADELGAAVPVIDARLLREVEERRAVIEQTVRAEARERSAAASSASARSASRIPVIVGTTLTLLGVLMLAIGQPLPGAAAAVLGIALAAVGLSRSKSHASTTTPPRPQVAPAPMAAIELQRLEARLLMEREKVVEAARRREVAAARVRELDLPSDPSELRRIASSCETAAADRERVAEWERRRTELEAAVAEAQQSLRSALAAHGEVAADDDDLDDAFQRYVEACRRRAQQATQAAEFACDPDQPIDRTTAAEWISRISERQRDGCIDAVQCFDDDGGVGGQPSGVKSERDSTRTYLTQPASLPRDGTTKCSTIAGSDVGPRTDPFNDAELVLRGPPTIAKERQLRLLTRSLVRRRVEPESTGPSLLSKATRSL